MSFSILTGDVLDVLPELEPESFDAVLCDTPRRLLVPFAGSGSEMIGALVAGWDEVTGIELDDDYADIARARLEHWLSHRPEIAQHSLFD